MFLSPALMHKLNIIHKYSFGVIVRALLYRVYCPWGYCPGVIALEL